eukprot:330508-Prymnesium_polylepis.1
MLAVVNGHVQISGAARSKLHVTGSKAHASRDGFISSSSSSLNSLHPVPPSLAATIWASSSCADDSPLRIRAPDASAASTSSRIAEAEAAIERARGKRRASWKGMAVRPGT